MTTITLRQYYREIESLIHNGQAASAEAHCRYILGVHPKAVAVHRLLGNTLIEKMDYSSGDEAYLQVLASIPDDIIAHIGLSVIREANGNLEAAGWHMQHAVEIQPANEILQADLRRLLSQGEGIVPPKIPLTRGSLARMYLLGGLYDQAIAELDAALADEPERIDLQCLLVQVYRQAGMIEQAAEKAESVLEKLPDCLEGNLVMYLAAIKGDSSADLNLYRLRLAALDPYSVHVSPENPNPAQVPDHKVEIETLQWQAAEN